MLLQERLLTPRTVLWPTASYQKTRQKNNNKNSFKQALQFGFQINSKLHPALQPIYQPMGKSRQIATRKVTLNTKRSEIHFSMQA